MALRVDEFSVLCGAGSELSVRLERNAGADWEGAMREALLGFQIANQFAAAALCDGLRGKRQMPAYKSTAATDCPPSTG